MTRLLKLAQFAQGHRMTEMQIGPGGVNTQLDPQGLLSGSQAFCEGSRPTGENVGNAARRELLERRFVPLHG